MTAQPTELFAKRKAVYLFTREAEPGQGGDKKK